MRIISLISVFTLGLFYAGHAQVDVMNTRANPKTFIFDDDKHTVHGYIYAQLKEKTSCCGNDAVYLEVKFDESGSVTSAKTLTGKNECYKQSVVDIVSSVRWDATDVKGTKTIYFEVKPIIPCAGGPSENVYKKIPRVGGGELASNTKPEEKSSEVAVVTPAKTEPVKPVETPKPVVTEPVKPVAVVEQPKPVEQPKVEEPKTEEPNTDVEGFLSDESGSDNSSTESKSEPVVTKVAEPVKPTPSNPTPVAEPSKPVAVVAKKSSGGGGKVPPQAKIDYVSTGDHQPDPSHKETWNNYPMSGGGSPVVSDQSTFGVQVRQNLRNAGYCGLAQALVEVEIDANGSVRSSRVMYANDTKVKEILPNLVRSMRFQAQPGTPGTFFSYYEVKTEIVCQGGKPQYNLEQVQPILKHNQVGGQP